MDDLELNNNVEMAGLLRSKLASSVYCPCCIEDVPTSAIMAVGELSVICQLGLFGKISKELALRLSNNNILANKDYYTLILELC